MVLHEAGAPEELPGAGVSPHRGSVKSSVLGIASARVEGLSLHLLKILIRLKMKTIGIFYGSTTGATEAVAQEIARQCGVGAADVRDVSKMTAGALAAYDVILFGSSTWGAGDLQDDWYGGIDVLRGCDLRGKTVALFGCGDSESYPDTFCGALGTLYDAARAAGAHVVGTVPVDDYSFEDSDAVRDGVFVGLALDEVNEGAKTQARISAWLADLKNELA